MQELRLMNMNLTGSLAPELGNLTSLRILDVMWNNISGNIPEAIGNLKSLTLLLLNGNQLSGALPDSLGYLPNLKRLQIDDNRISGSIPKSFQYLNKASHFHMNNNSLSGRIPSELGRLQSLLHLLLDNNKLSEQLPPELSNISTLLILQLDNNQFTGSMPQSYYNISKLLKLSLRNCSLSGTIQNLTSLISLTYLDLSRNQLDGELPSGSLPDNLTTLILSYNQLNGTLKENLNEMPNLQYLGLRNNGLQGAVPHNFSAGVKYTSSLSRLIIDLRDNSFQKDDYTNYTSNVTVWLNGNPACSSIQLSKECNVSNLQLDIKDISDDTPSIISLPSGCSSDTCDPSENQELAYGVLKELGKCLCDHPLFVGYRLKSPEFTYFPPLENDFINYFSDGLRVFPYQVNISDFKVEPGPRLRMNIKLFPNYPLQKFNDTEVLRLYSTLSDWSFSDSPIFGPTELLYFSIFYPYNLTSLMTSNHALSIGAYAGIVIGCVLFTAAAMAGAMLMVFKQYKGRASKNLGKTTGQERIKIAGVKDFTFEAMALATQNFSDSMQVGQGGYGKVYRGVLADGRVVAIKRAKEGSLQGENEFYTEIELLCRVHHRNLVSLVGYCDDEGEQMLVYEFMANGTLRDHLSTRSRRPLDFRTRIQIALGSARGILYLHTEANPPIFHRDIKASNILLDEKNNTKVADFGLSKLAPISDVEGVAPGHVSTVVKGTPGYLDPEYFLTKKLTDKSDVYSFGVVLLELITGMQPISRGKNLVREVNMAYEAGMMLTFVDSRMGSYPSECLEPLVRLAISCCKDDTNARPSMAEVVRGLDDILHATPLPEASSSISLDQCGMDVNDLRSFRMPTSRSEDIDGSDLMSVTIPSVAPR